MAGNSDSAASSGRIQLVLLGGLTLSGEQTGLLHELFADCAKLHVVKLHGGFSGALVLSTQGFDGAGNPDEPSVTKIDRSSAMQAETHRADAIRPALGTSAPATLRGPVYGCEYGAVVLECAGACWVLPQFCTPLAGRSVKLISTYRDLVMRQLADLAADASALRATSASVHSEDALLGVMDDLWGPGGPLRQLALSSAASRRFRGTGGLAEESLFHIADAAIHVLLPGRDDARFSASAARLPAPLFEALEALVAARLPGAGRLLGWSRQPARFDHSLMANAGDDTATMLAQATPLATCLRVLHSLAAGSDKPNGHPAPGQTGTASAVALPAEWAPANPHSHGDLNGANILVDLKGCCWLIDFSYAGPASASAFDDPAKLLACVLLEYLPLADDAPTAFVSDDRLHRSDHNRRASEERLAHAQHVVDLLLPADGRLLDAAAAQKGSDGLEGRPPLPPFAELALRLGRKLLALAADVASAMSAEVHSRRVVAAPAGARALSACHPALLLLPLLRHALLALRFRDTSALQKRLAWHVVVRAASALEAALQLAPAPLTVQPAAAGLASRRLHVSPAIGEVLVLRCGSHSAVRPDWRLVRVRERVAASKTDPTNAPLVLQTLWSGRRWVNDSAGNITRPHIEWDALGRIHHMDLRLPPTLPEETTGRLATASAHAQVLQDPAGGSAHLAGTRAALDAQANKQLAAVIDAASGGGSTSSFEAAAKVDQWAFAQLERAALTGGLRYAGQQRSHGGQQLIVYDMEAGAWCEASVAAEQAADGPHRVLLSDGRALSLLLSRYNHAPRAMTLQDSRRALLRYYHGLRIAHSTLVDPLSGVRLDILDHCVPLRFLAASKSSDDERLNRLVSEGGVPLLSDVQGLHAHLRRRHGELASGAREHAPDTAMLVTAPPAAGKSSFISQLVMLALPTEAPDPPTAPHKLALVPICIRLVDLALMLGRAEYAGVFAHAWNWVDAYLRVTYGGESDRYVALRQALIARQALLLLDGLDEGGAHRTALEEHITATLAPQGHLLVVTARPNGITEGLWGAFQQLQLGGLTRGQQQGSLAPTRASGAGAAPPRSRGGVFGSR